MLKAGKGEPKCYKVCCARRPCFIFSHLGGSSDMYLGTVGYQGRKYRTVYWEVLGGAGRCWEVGMEKGHPGGQCRNVFTVLG